MGRLYAFFFVSGFPALIYQVVWQRSLFTIYGVHSESIAVVVAAFLLGLGLGSIAGGALTKHTRAPLLLLFAGIELGIGLFGLASLPLFRAVGGATLGASTASTFLLSFLLVVLPTMLMGATLPILTEFLVRRDGNVGRSVGVLYAVNTFGSATACFVAALWLLPALGQSGTVNVAAWLNFVVGAGALWIYFRERPGVHEAAPRTILETARPRLLPFPVALLLVLLTGFIALSYEILWARAYGFVSGGRAQAFPLLLGAFLVGIGGGALLSRRYCSRIAGDGTHLRALAWFVLYANVVGFFVIPVLVNFCGFTWRWTGSLVFVAAAAAMLGATFPLLCHAAIPSQKHAGSRLSYLYFANIAGSVAGSLITGFLLFEVWSTRTIGVFLPFLGLALGAGLLWYSDPASRPQRRHYYFALTVAGIVISLVQLLFDDMWERLLFKTERGVQRFAHVVETRAGVITVAEDGTIYGGGAYDGAFSTDPVNDVNGITRAYALSYLHPDPKRVLLIGLSSGSWASVIAAHESVDSLTIVDINPGYVSLLERFPEVRGLPSNPKVRIVIDDGRRWLAATDESYDVIVMNTTFAWRGYVSNLLSTEFLDLARKRLRPGGVHYFNCNVSPEAMRTAMLAFPHGIRFQTMVAVSDTPLRLDKTRWLRTLQGFPAFMNGQSRARLREILAIADRRGTGLWDSTETREAVLARTEGMRVITDDNMGIEWRERPRLPLPGLD